MVLTLWICPPFSEGERDCSSHSSVHSPCELEEGLEGVKVEWGRGEGRCIRIVTLPVFISREGMMR